jgi:hypothetical protein
VVGKSDYRPERKQREREKGELKSWATWDAGRG